MFRMGMLVGTKRVTTPNHSPISMCMTLRQIAGRPCPILHPIREVSTRLRALEERFSTHLLATTDHTGGAWINGRICVAGGRNGGEIGWPEVAPTDCYDVATRTWSVEAPIPNPRAGSSYGTSCDGSLLVAGGEGSGKAWDTVEVFDGTSWSSLKNLVVGRHGSGLAVDCVCDTITIASGASGQGGGPEIRSVEMYFANGVDDSAACTA